MENEPMDLLSIGFELAVQEIHNKLK